MRGFQCGIAFGFDYISYLGTSEANVLHSFISQDTPPYLNLIRHCTIHNHILRFLMHDDVRAFLSFHSQPYIHRFPLSPSKHAMRPASIASSAQSSRIPSYYLRSPHLSNVDDNMSNGRLQDKVALITGSSSGLGRAICHAYAREGALICCADLYAEPRNPVDPATGKADSFHNRTDGEPTHRELRRLGYRASFVQVDMTKAEDAALAVRVCVEEYGRLDIMVNNAGISVESTHTRAMGIHETSEEDYDRTMAINAKGVFLGCKYAVKQMLLGQELRPGEKDRGWIVNTASVQGLVGYYGTCEHCPKESLLELSISNSTDVIVSFVLRGQRRSCATHKASSAGLCTA